MEAEKVKFLHQTFSHSSFSAQTPQISKARPPPAQRVPKESKKLNVPQMALSHRRSSQKLSTEHLSGAKKGDDHFYQLYLEQLCGNRDPFMVSKVMDLQIRQISIQLFSLWHKVMDTFCKDAKVFCYQMRQKNLEH